MTTIGHIDLGEGLDGDFDRARRWALARSVLARLRGERRALLSFGESGALSGPHDRAYMGRRPVEIEKIVGSVGRARDFNRAFLPVTGALRERWRLVNRAFRRAHRLPPVVLNKVGDYYFVVDGNHRVSVARYHGAEWIDAEVTEFRGAAEASDDHAHKEMRRREETRA
jgi:hypothetical protein